MSTRITDIVDRIRGFWANTNAVAAVEFAGILPLMLTLYLGSVELSTTISVDKRVATVSGSLGDLVARSKNGILMGDVNDFFVAASATMAPYDASDVQQVVTCVKVNSTGTAKVGWSVATNGANAHTVGTPFTVPSDLKTLAPEGYIIVAEAQLSYKPLFGYFFNSAFNLYHQFFFLPRFGSEIELDNDDGSLYRTCNVS